MKSKHEADLAAQLDRELALVFSREHRILKGRLFRGDFAVGLRSSMNDPALPDWPRPEWNVLVEVNGQGPHGHHGGYGHAASDAEKLSACACLGYRVLVVTGKQVASGEALKWIRCAVGLEGDAETVFAKRRAKRGIRSHRPTRSKGLRGLPERVKRAAGL